MSRLAIFAHLQSQRLSQRRDPVSVALYAFTGLSDAERYAVVDRFNAGFAEASPVKALAYDDGKAAAASEVDAVIGQAMALASQQAAERRAVLHEGVEPVAIDGSNADAGAFTRPKAGVVGLADRAPQKVSARGAWLKDRFFAVAMAGGAYAVRWLTGSIVILERIDSRAAPGVFKPIARRLCGKLIPVTLFALKLQKLIFQHRMMALGLDQAIVEIKNKRLSLGGRPFTAPDHLLEIFETFGGAGKRGSCGAETADESPVIHP